MSLAATREPDADDCPEEFGEFRCSRIAGHAGEHRSYLTAYSVDTASMPALRRAKHGWLEWVP